MSDVHAVILAGGGGSLWPLPRQHLPKQPLLLQVISHQGTLQRRGATERLYHTKVNRTFT